MDWLPAFLAMGGYAGFVWPAYAVTFAVMVAVLIVSVRAARSREAELALLQQMRPGRVRRRPANPESNAP